MPPKPRVRHNEKGRAGQRAKEEALRKSRQHGRHCNPRFLSKDEATDDTNVDMILPKLKAEKEEQRALLKAKLSSEIEGTMSSKKKKRLDRYIESKLRNDEKVKLMKILGEQERTKGMISTKAMKRTKRAEKTKVNVDDQDEEFQGFSEDEAENSTDRSEDESYIQADNGADISVAPIPSLSSSGFGQSALNSAGPDKKRDSEGAFGFATSANVTLSAKKQKSKPSLKYNWRAKLEAEKARKAGYTVDRDNSDPDSSEVVTSESENEENEEEDGNSGVQSGEGGRGSKFKAWALEQAELPSASFVNLPTDNLDISEHHVPRPRSKSPEPNLTADLLDPKLTARSITRPEHLELLRLELPVTQYEQEIVEKIRSHSVVIVSGATGSGKTTQIPQFLYEAGFKGIGVTQPRRVAAVSMAARVGAELGSDHADKVGYQVRFDSSVKEGTCIKFMTDGVLLREISQDFTLKKYEILIIDEAHERSINTDILIGLLSRIIRLRKQSALEGSGPALRVVIMSATLRVADFAENTALFKIPPPIMTVEARQYPVSVHFSKRTEFGDYVSEAVDKICKIHQKLPPGGILVFLTGQAEIVQAQKLLKEKYGKAVIKGLSDIPKVTLKAVEGTIEAEDMDDENPELINKKLGPTTAGKRGHGTSSSRAGARRIFKRTDHEEMVDDFDKGEESDISDIEELEEDKIRPLSEREQKFIQVLPLYSLLPTTEQLKVFQSPPANTRQIILATNIAETSLTIPGMRYVVDSGRSKERRYDGKVQSFEIDFISKASAEQRAGRAGRTGPGHCYRLFSSAVFDTEFPLFSEAEILRTPIEGVVLQMKSMNIHTIQNFPFPTPPSKEGLRDAERLLINLGALDSEGKITKLGEQMSLFPLSPRFAKMVCLADQGGVLPYVIAIVSALSVEDPFIRAESIDDNEDDQDGGANGMSEERKKRRQAYYRSMKAFSRLDNGSDALRLLGAVCAYDWEADTASFCLKSYLRVKAMEEIRKLRGQLSNVLRAVTDINLPKDLRLGPPSATQVELLNQIVGAGFLDQICIRADLIPQTSVQNKKHSSILHTAYVPLATTNIIHSDGSLHDGLCYLHPASYNIQQLSPAPAYIIFSSLSKSSNPNNQKVRIKALTYFKAEWIVSVAKNTPLLTFSKPLEYPPPRLLDGGKKREVWCIPKIAISGSGKMSWELPPRKVEQSKIATRWETVMT